MIRNKSLITDNKELTKLLAYHYKDKVYIRFRLRYLRKTALEYSLNMSVAIR
jgi:hypothetical protein